MLLLCVGCATLGQQAPLSAAPPGVPPPAGSSAAGSAEAGLAPLRIELVEQIEAGQFPDWRFVLVNESAERLVYRGYAPHAPLHATQVRTAAGWERRTVGYCGTGVEEQALSPGAEVLFEAGSWGPGPWRFGVELRRPSGGDPVVVWSEPVHRGAGAR